MSARIHFISVGWFFLGVLCGFMTSIWIAEARSAQTTMESLKLIKEAEIGDYGMRAQKAYQRESPAVGIYALNQYLDLLRQNETFLTNGAKLMSASSINYDRMVAYARVAQLHQRAGQTNEAAQALAQAAEYAQRNLRLLMFTNASSLAELVRRLDRVPVR